MFILWTCDHTLSWSILGWFYNYSHMVLWEEKINRKQNKRGTSYLCKTHNFIKKHNTCVVEQNIILLTLFYQKQYVIHQKIVRCFCCPLHKNWFGTSIYPLTFLMSAILCVQVFLSTPRTKYTSTLLLLVTFRLSHLTMSEANLKRLWTFS